MLSPALLFTQISNIYTCINLKDTEIQFYGFLSTVNRSNNLRMLEGFSLLTLPLPTPPLASASSAGIWSLERPSVKTFSDSLASGKWTVCLLRIGTRRLYLLIFLLSSDIDSACRLRADFHFSWNGVQGSDGKRVHYIHNVNELYVVIGCE